MGLPFFDRDSVHRRLDRTICLFQGEPVYIRTQAPPAEPRPMRTDIQGRIIVENNTWAVAGGGGQPVLPLDLGVNDHTVSMYDLPYTGHVRQLLDYRDTGFSYKPTLLGYGNFEKAIYLTRTPARQQKQGLSDSQLVGTPTLPKMANWFTSKEMKDCILGKYPTKQEAEEILSRGDKSSVAISRDVAIWVLPGNARGLGYKGRQVGYRSNGKYTLIDSAETKILRTLLEDLL